MTALKKLFGFVFILAGLFSAMAVHASEEAPDVLIKRISGEVLDIAKTDKDIQKGSMQRILQVVEEKIFPHVDFSRMTALATGRHWRQATPEQQQQLIEEFRKLLVYTYSGAISQVKDEKVEFRRSRFEPADTDVEVQTRVVRARGEPVPLNYRMHKTAQGWKIYDVNVLGAWLIETYKGNFASEINKGGIDGLIKTLSERNKRLAEGVGKNEKRS